MRGMCHTIVGRKQPVLHPHGSLRVKSNVPAHQTSFLKTNLENHLYNKELIFFESP